MTSTLRWGFIGNGWIAKVLAEDFKIAGLTLQAVGARTEEKAEEFAQTYSVPNRHSSYEALVNDPEVDIVYVATPHPFHMRDTLLAISAGKHVLCEKPFTINAKEAQAMVDAARSKNVFLMEAMWTRFIPAHIAIQEVLKSGVIGDVKIIEANHTRYLVDSRRLWDPALGGGALLDLGVYPLNFIMRLLGTPTKIDSTAKITDEGVDEYLLCKMEFADGKMASLLTTSSVMGANNATVYGEKGRIEIDGPAWEKTTFTVFNQAGDEIQRFTQLHEGTGRQYQALEVEKRIQAGEIESTIMPLNETVAIMKTMDTIRKQIGVKYPME